MGYRALPVWTLLCFLAASLSLEITVPAQSPTATLTGTVVDEAGSVVGDTVITVTNELTGVRRETVTTSEGFFTMPLLPPGNYIVRASREGFEPVEIRVILNVNVRTSIQIPLPVRKIGEAVTVSPEQGLLESPAIGTVINRRFVANLPLNGRSLQSLIRTTPGVVLTKANSDELGQFSVNGQRADSNYLLLDGVSVNIGVPVIQRAGQSAAGSLPGLSAFGGTSNLVSVDALEEFRLLGSTYAPEFGRMPGGQVSMVTRSGTNQFSGSLFEYFRNDALDANDWFNNALRLPKAPLRQNNFGAVLGGPIARNRTFFFASYEGVRLRLPRTTTISVPSMTSRRAAPVRIRPILNAFPLPNGEENVPSGLASFTGAFSDPSSLDAVSLRLDHLLSGKIVLFGRVNHSPSETSQRGGSGTSLSNFVVTRVSTQTVTAGATMLLTPLINNELRANYSRNGARSRVDLDDFGGAIPLSESSIFPPFASPVDGQVTVALVFTPLLALGRNVDNVQRQVNITDNLSLISGAHEGRFGADYRRLRPLFEGRAYDQLAVFLGVPQALTGNALQIAINANSPVTVFFTNLSLFAQDTWRIRERIALTYGVRWELNPPPSATRPGLFTLDGLDGRDPRLISLAEPGTPLYDTTYSNFAPRVGIAYHLSQHPKRETVLRGGFGVFYDLGAGSLATAVNGFPFTASKTVFNAPYPLNSAAAEPPTFTTVPSSSTITVAHRRLRLPRTFQWSATIEQSLGSLQRLSASYVAAVGRNLLRQERVLTPNASFRQVNVTRNASTSDYHALQMKFERMLASRMQYLISYTWSHSIDTASNDSFLNLPSMTFDPSNDRGPSDYDVRHSFSAAVTYDPGVPALTTLPRRLLRDWSIDAIVTARSATPVNIVSSRTVGFTPLPFRPDRVPGEPLYLDDSRVAGGRRINPNAFAIPVAVGHGTLGRNALRGFSYYQADVAVRRSFPLSERVRLQVKGEFFNVLNHPNLADPNGNLNAPTTFGRSTSMLGRSLGSGGLGGGFNPLYQVGGPRSIQLAVRLQY